MKPHGPALTTPTHFTLGDVVRLRKPHPCGGYDWTVVRLGADIGLRCATCQRKVLLPRRTLERRLKTFLSRAEPPPDVNEPAPPESSVLDISERA
ncbi:MAG: DUF951 domain-containing protein [Chloroflexia bacterium]|nr:DUF951 domain-containing protein [Chloroflexia bacterium]MDQ3412835.1 DUF951 domain-containing protein [Chloroflexota bacterium]